MPSNRSTLRMSKITRIEWTDSTWNPITGCTKVSAGCKHCYAETLSERFRGTKGHYFERGFDLTMRPAMLEQPLKWEKPRMIFVCSMSDLFHESVPIVYIDRVFDIMEQAYWHTFQVLTKRVYGMRTFLKSRYRCKTPPKSHLVRNLRGGSACRAAHRGSCKASNPTCDSFPFEPLIESTDPSTYDLERHRVGHCRGRERGQFPYHGP